MLKSMEKNKKYIFWVAAIGLFGIAGLLLVPVVKCIIKISNRYPKAFRRTVFTVFVFLCIYGLLFEREWNMSSVIICIGVVIAYSSILNTNDR